MTRASPFSFLLQHIAFMNICSKSFLKHPINRMTLELIDDGGRSFSMAPDDCLLGVMTSWISSMNIFVEDLPLVHARLSKPIELRRLELRLSVDERAVASSSITPFAIVVPLEGGAANICFTSSR